MIDADRNADRRVLVLAPTGKDAELAQEVLEKAGIETFICPDVECLRREMPAGVGCILVAEEALTAETRQVLSEALASQPRWSDLPLLVLTRQGADPAAVATSLEGIGNVSLLERPLHVATLVSAAQTALRARSRQYELRDRFAVQSLLAAIVESSGDAIVSKTLDGTILTWNAGAERIFGYSALEVIGKPITIIVPYDRRDEEQDILERLRRGERVEHFDTVRVTKDGRLIDVSLSISPIRDASDRVVGASKVARDVSAQKRAEQALRDADRRKDEFLATLAHELRNPLAPLRNSLHLLRLSGSSDPAVEQVREMMERQINHMVRLVDDLMELSRITRGKIELRKERVHLADVIHNAIETSQPVVDAAGHTLVLDIPDEPIILHADPVRLAQVFANLINNAAKYTPRAGQIWCTARRENGSIVVTIRDTGIGIPSDMLPRVFDMFTQVDSSHHRIQSGLGIGLTLVQSLIELHGGTVAALSEGLGKGSEFVVRLPVADILPAETAPPKRAPSALAPVRVLVVDDNYDAADSLGMLVECLGAEVHVVHDGPAALHALETFHPALVLLDIGMPGMDGYEVARRIRLHPEFQDLTLIALTGWGQDEDRRRSHAAGIDYHLIKPPDIDTLQALMVSVGNNERKLPRQGHHG